MAIRKIEPFGKNYRLAVRIGRQLFNRDWKIGGLIEKIDDCYGFELWIGKKINRDVLKFPVRFWEIKIIGLTIKFARPNWQKIRAHFLVQNLPEILTRKLDPMPLLYILLDISATVRNNMKKLKFIFFARPFHLSNGDLVGPKFFRPVTTDEIFLTFFWPQFFKKNWIFWT